MSEWINVADCRPYVGQHPWVTVEYNKKRTVERLYFRPDGFAKSQFFGYPINEHVVAWKFSRSKPEPYIGERKDIRTVWRPGRN